MKRFSLSSSLSLLVTFFVMLSTSARAQVGISAFSSTPDSSNYYAEINFTFTVGNGAGNELVGGVDFVALELSSGYVVPASIDPRLITINGATAAGVSVNGNRIEITVPALISGTGRNNPTATVLISDAAEIRNPRNAGMFQIGVFTSKQTARNVQNVNIVQSTSTLSQAAVTPNTSVEFRSSRYTLFFSVGRGGALDLGDQIVINFPTGTTIPDGSLAGVTFNNTTAAAVGNFATRQVTIFVPAPVKNSAEVTLIFSRGTGIQNPMQGTFSVSLSSTVEPSASPSQNYSISSAANLSFSSISLSNDTANAVSAITIDFVVSTSGALSPALGDQISFIFPTQFTVPSFISSSNISVQNITTGFGNIPSQATVRGDTIFFAVPDTIGNGDEVRVTFNEAAGIQNPAQPTSYALSAATFEQNQTVIEAETASNLFGVKSPSTQVTSAQVTLSNTTANALGVSYTLDFNVGSFGQLESGVSTINIRFPTGTTIESSVSALVNGQIAAASAIDSRNLSITVPPSISIPNNAAVNIQISGITNPGSGTYTLNVSSSVETTQSTSQIYGIDASSLKGSATVNVNQNLVNATASYQIGGFSVSSNAARLSFNDGDFVRVIFPEGAIIPTSIAAGSVTLGGATVSSVSTNPSSRTVTLFVAGQNQSPTSVNFATGAGIANPSIPSTGYNVTVFTSADLIPLVSNNFTILATNNQPTINNVTVTPALSDGNPAQYQISFSTGANGRLVGGTSFGSNTITLNFQGGVTNVPAEISSSSVNINGLTPSTVAVTASGINGTIVLGMPNGALINGNGSGTITFLKAAGLVNVFSNNPGSNGTARLQTSAEQQFGTRAFTLSSTSTLNVNSVSLTSAVSNANSGYTIRFSPGTGNGLSTGQAVSITFPVNTFVPTSINRSSVKINSTEPTSTPVVSGNTISLTSPVSLPADVEAIIQFGASSGLLNPTSAGSNYIVMLSTAFEPAVSSPAYTIVAGNSTISTPEVTLSDARPTTLSDYTIRFNTGSNGRLKAGSSTISVFFPTGTTVPTSISGTLNGTAITAASSGQTATLTVPANVNILNNTQINLVLKGITNPSVSNNFVLTAKTSVETTSVGSVPYTISNIPGVNVLSFSVTQDTVNALGDYSFAFDIADALSAGSGRIIIRFSETSSVPTAIPLSALTVNGVQPQSISPNTGTKVVKITVAQAVSAGRVNVQFQSGSGVVNPSEPGDYTAFVSTSAQPLEVQTDPISVLPSFTTSVSSLSVSASPQLTGQPVSWTWNFNTGARGALQPGVGTIILDFAGSVFSIDPVPASAVTILGSPVNTVITDVAAGKLTLVVPNDVTIGNNFPTTIHIAPSGGIEINPTLGAAKKTPIAEIMSSETFAVETSAEPVPQSQDLNPLPIKLGSFEVRLGDDQKSARVEWVTFTELENYGFLVERLSPGQEDHDENWKQITFVEGNGFSTSIQNYSYTDLHLNEAGTYSYRLRQIDYNGAFEVFGPINLFFSSPEEVAIRGNYPNPFNPSTRIEYQIPEQARVRLQIYDVLGRMILNLVDTRQNAGRYTVIFDASNLASGMYFARLVTEQSNVTHKMLLVK